MVCRYGCLVLASNRAPNKSLNPTANSGSFIEKAFLIAVVRGGLAQALDGCVYLKR